MHIRSERPADVPRIAALVEAAFARAEEARIVEAIRASDRFVDGLSLVAEEGHELIGHILLSYVDVEPGSHRVLQLAPLAVLPSHQRRGVGTALVREALRRAEGRSVPVVLVEGDPRYYGRFGFRPSVEVGIDPPAGVSSHVFTARTLGAYEASLRGQAVYPKAFAGGS